MHCRGAAPLDILTRAVLCQLTIYVGCSPFSSNTQATPTTGGYGGAAGGAGAAGTGSGGAYRGGRGGGLRATFALWEGGPELRSVLCAGGSSEVRRGTTRLAVAGGGGGGSACSPSYLMHFQAQNRFRSCGGLQALQTLVRASAVMRYALVAFSLLIALWARSCVDV
jgi:hypothetical protein